MDPPEAQTQVNIQSVVIEETGGIGGGFGGGLDLQTEIVTDSHRTICANDMFQSVSTICRVFLPAGFSHV